MAEWYRSPEWNEEIEEAFFAKLARARSQRDQYIVIQALTLAEGFPEVALRLVDFYFETRTDDFDDGRARLAASRARFALGGYEQALDNYAGTIGALGEERDLHVGSPIQFAFLAARSDRRSITCSRSTCWRGTSRRLPPRWSQASPTMPPSP